MSPTNHRMLYDWAQNSLKRCSSINFSPLHLFVQFCYLNEKFSLSDPARLLSYKEILFLRLNSRQPGIRLRTPLNVTVDKDFFLRYQEIWI